MFVFPTAPCELGGRRKDADRRPRPGIEVTFAHDRRTSRLSRELATGASNSGGRRVEWSRFAGSVRVVVPPHEPKPVEKHDPSVTPVRLLGAPVRAFPRPSGASTGGMLPVNMCGPAARAGCDWSGQHTPPQASTAPPSPPTEGNAGRGGCYTQNNDARMERGRGGRVHGRREEGEKRELRLRKISFYAIT